MSTKAIIRNLQKAISSGKSQEIINEYINVIRESIQEAAREPSFYQLPFSTISKIVQEVDFCEEKDPLKIIEDIIAGTSREHPDESFLLLKVFTYDKIPEFTKEEYISILSKFSLYILNMKIKLMNKTIFFNLLLGVPLMLQLCRNSYVSPGKLLAGT